MSDITDSKAKLFTDNGFFIDDTLKFFETTDGMDLEKLVDELRLLQISKRANLHPWLRSIVRNAGLL